MTVNCWVARAKEAELAVSNFINGEAVECGGDEKIQKLAPRDGSFLYQFGEGGGDEVADAVACARYTFEEGVWSRSPIYSRKTVLQSLANLIEARKEQFALYDCLDVGKPIIQALADVSQAVGMLRHYVEAADKVFSPSASDGCNFTLQLRKPVGVVGAIVGWNFPLVLAIQKLGPALAMGNSLVLKPSEFSGLSASLLAQLAFEAGVPAGVFNVVQGTGGKVGDALARHSDIDLLSFTGSSSTGKQLMISAGQSNMKRLMLECGGKSPYIVFDDCPRDFDVIAGDIVETAFYNQGEVCVAGTRLLIHQDIKDQLLPLILSKVDKLRPQDPLLEETTFGALINQRHLQKVLNYIDSGQKEGAKLVYGGKQIAVNIKDSGNQGYYVEPTVFDDVDPSQRIAQEEIFGPVLSVFTFKDEEEALNIANNSCYGLSAYVVTENLGRAQRVGQSLHTGAVIVTGATKLSSGLVDIGVEGHRQSGFGHEGGVAGLVSYTKTTALYMMS